jgi:hypothetical protein
MLSRLWLLVLLLAPAAHADYLYTWHGYSNLFQASFTISDPNNLPGVYWYSLPGLSVTSPDGLFSYHGGRDDTEGLWPAMLIIDLFDEGQQRYVYGDVNRFFERVWENDQFGSVLYNEPGSWSVSYIPEPGSLMLLCLGGGLVWVYRQALRRKVAHRVLRVRRQGD